MIHFPVLRTRRLTAQLRELSIGEALEIAAVPAHMEEAACTAFLRRAVASASGVEDPAHWTVQERMLAVCHYLASSSDEGPDFSVGDGRYQDYLDAAVDTPAGPVEVGSVGGDEWTVRHLTGAMAESIERIDGEVEGVSGRLHWLLGAMAAQMLRVGEESPDPAGSGSEFDEYLRDRMLVMRSYPESDFAGLAVLHAKGRAELHHLFGVEFAVDGGLVAMPREGAAAGLPPARFPVHSCLTEMARELVGKSAEPGP